MGSRPELLLWGWVRLRRGALHVLRTGLGCRLGRGTILGLRRRLRLRLRRGTGLGLSRPVLWLLGAEFRAGLAAAPVGPDASRASRAELQVGQGEFQASGA